MVVNPRGLIFVDRADLVAKHPLDGWFQRCNIDYFADVDAVVDWLADGPATMVLLSASHIDEKLQHDCARLQRATHEGQCHHLRGNCVARGAGCVQFPVRLAVSTDQTRSS